MVGRNKLKTYKERRTILFISISLAFLLGLISSIFTINFFKIEPLFFKTIYLFVGTFGVVVFVYILFLPIFKDYFGNPLVLFKNKKGERKIKQKTLRELIYVLIFLSFILLFIGLIQFLDELAHPLIISSSFLISSGIIIIYGAIRKKTHSNSKTIFSFLFGLSSLIMLILVLSFSFPNSPSGINRNPFTINFEFML